MTNAWMAALLGILAGAASMSLYAKLSPQSVLRSLQTAQKESRINLKHYDGDMRGLFSLIAQDFGITFRQLRFILLPALISLSPCIALLMVVQHYVSGEYAEIIYFAALIAMSLYLKLRFHIV